MMHNILNKYKSYTILFICLGENDATNLIVRETLSNLTL